MIRLDCEQGSPEWLQARLGIPTASAYSKILTPKTMKISESSVGYRNQLLAEYLLGEPQDTGDFDFTDRGTRLEERARAFYEMQRDVDVDRVGFLMRDDRRTGGSPDGLVDPAGGVEIKCPSAAVHIGYLLDGGGEKYRCQVMGNIWIGELEWMDFLSFHPTLPPALVRYHRDEKFIGILESVVGEFCDRLDAAKAEFEARGIRPGPPKLSYEAARAFFTGVG